LSIISRLTIKSRVFPGRLARQLVEALCALPERLDYSALRNPRSSCRRLALRLAHFDIHPHNIQVDARQSKGYDLTDFAAAFQLTPLRLNENAPVAGLTAPKSDEGGADERVSVSGRRQRQD